MKQITITFVPKYYGTFFLENNIILGYVHENDGDWREEYFNPILENLGYKVNNKPTPEQVCSISKYAEDLGLYL